jgi:hypothetical protein
MFLQAVQARLPRDLSYLQIGRIVNVAVEDADCSAIRIGSGPNSSSDRFGFRVAVALD